MKRLINREIWAVVNMLEKEFSNMVDAEVEKEYKILTSNALSKSMKKRAKLIDAFIYGGATDTFANIFKYELRAKAKQTVYARLKTKGFNRLDVYDQVVLSQVDSKDLTDLLKDIRTSLNI